MTSVSAEMVQKQFGQVLDDLRLGPVVVRQGGEEVAAVVSMDDYERIRQDRTREFLRFCDEVGEKSLAKPAPASRKRLPSRG